MALLGSGPAAALDAPPAWAVVLMLLSVTAGIAGVFSIGGATWASANPDWSLFLARNIAWDGSHIWDYQKYPQRVIGNSSSVSEFGQNLSPESVRFIDYTQGGQLKQADFEQFIQSTQTTSFIMIKNGTIVGDRLRRCGNVVALESSFKNGNRRSGEGTSSSCTP